MSPLSTTPLLSTLSTMSSRDASSSPSTRIDVGVAAAASSPSDEIVRGPRPGQRHDRVRSGRASVASRRNAARNAPALRVGTRKAASSSSREPGAACSVAVRRRASVASRAIARYRRSAAARASVSCTRLTSRRSRLRDSQKRGARDTGRSCARSTASRTAFSSHVRRSPHSSWRSMRARMRAIRLLVARDVRHRALVGGEEREELHRQHRRRRQKVLDHCFVRHRAAADPVEILQPALQRRLAVLAPGHAGRPRARCRRRRRAAAGRGCQTALPARTQRGPPALRTRQYT